MKSIKLYANAKINLHLDVTNKRTDGYHDIRSLMQSVSLYDVVTVEYENKDIKEIVISCSDSNIPCNEKNIAYKAADMLISSGYVKIHIEKNIPSPAGMAGGSADAAAVIYALNKLAELDLTYDELINISSKVGADVPFCLFGGSMDVCGIGDVMKPVPNINAPYVLISIMGDGVSTPMAYRLLDEKYDNFKNYKEQVTNVYEVIGKHEGGLFNIFEDIIKKERPYVEKIKNIMESFGGISLMSGSGPAVFGIFKTQDELYVAKNTLENIGAKTYICSFTDKGIIEI